jgi:hypothetical protein
VATCVGASIGAPSGEPPHAKSWQQAGKPNWDKFGPAVALIEQARKDGTRITVHGRAWTGKKGGGCRASAADWTWNP